jgi:hypothetical protein
MPAICGKNKPTGDSIMLLIEGTKEIPLLSLNPCCVDKVALPVNADLNFTEDAELVYEEKSFWKKSGEVIKEWVFLDPKVWLS